MYPDVCMCAWCGWQPCVASLPVIGEASRLPNSYVPDMHALPGSLLLIGRPTSKPGNHLVFKQVAKPAPRLCSKLPTAQHKYLVAALSSGSELAPAILPSGVGWVFAVQTAQQQLQQQPMMDSQLPTLIRVSSLVQCPPHRRQPAPDFRPSSPTS